ncbi:MAG TPA: cytochrome c [Candidatus Methylacidiphilales bacterium]|jgi:mono/diheme cytochrome c family protein|nr:cytochrome c [Candidatus Methylacidiphilales bacterium]
MSHENPDLISPTPPDPQVAIQPNSPDFRETPDIEPFSDLREHFPPWLYIFCGIALFLAGSSFTGFQTFGRDMLDQGPGGPAGPAAGAQVEAPLTPAQIGAKVYSQNCASCHQGNGGGTAGIYPPLAGSEFVLGSKLRLAAILLKGLQGSVTVKGATFNASVMPPWEATITPDKLAALMTYIRGNSQWGNSAGPVTEDEVNAAKTKFSSHKATFTEPELLSIAPNGPDPTDKK